MASTNRLKSYKNRSLDSDELRRRREEEGVQLRKAKREEQLLKRRNVDPSVVGHEVDLSPQNLSATLESLARSIFSNDLETQVDVTTRFKLLVSQEKYGLISEIVAMGILPRLVEFLKYPEHTGLPFEAAWVLTNIASGSSAETAAVVRAGAVPVFISLLQVTTQVNLIEQVVWALGNIAGDGTMLRDCLLDQGVLPPLLIVMETHQSATSLVRNSAWAIINLCRGKKPFPPFEKVKVVLPTVSRLLYHEDSHVLGDACRIISLLSETKRGIQALVDAGVCRRLIELFRCQSASIQGTAMRSIGNIVMGDDVQTQVVLNCSLLPNLRAILETENRELIKEALWTLSNIAAGNRGQIQAVIDANLFPRVIHFLANGEYIHKKEAVWVVSNAVFGGSIEQIRYIVSLECLAPLCQVLSAPEPRVVTAVLAALGKILLVGKKDAGMSVNQYALQVEEVNGTQLLATLATDPHNEHSAEADRLLDSFFDEEKDAHIQLIDGNESGDATQLTTAVVPMSEFQF